MSAVAFGFVLLTAGTPAQEGLRSGEPILVSTGDGQGPLPSISISATPLGTAFVFGGERPDLFVSSDRWDPGFHLYRWVRDTEAGVPVFAPPMEVDASALPELKDHALQDHSTAAYVFQTADAAVHGLWVTREECVVARFDREAMRFDVVSRIALTGLPRLARAARRFKAMMGEGWIRRSSS